MAEMVPLKVGEVLTPNPGGSWDAHWAELRVINLEVDGNGITYVWVKMIPKRGGSGSYNTLTLNTLRMGWRRKTKFFQLGKTYKFRGNAGDRTWKILEVYLTERPIAGNGKAKAVARMKSKLGEDIQTLSEIDFERMIEA